MDIIYQRKINNIRSGATPKVLDLFSGCGGISLGFKAAGFDIRAAVEIDEKAAESHALNFFKDQNNPEHAMSRDIVLTEPEDLVEDLGLGELEDAIDVIVGGPPCQAFARVGRAKLREIEAHPEAYIHDPRGNLYLRYLHYVKKFKPVAILMENVPDMLNYGGHNIAEEVSETLADLGYVCHYTLLNAVHYGVPEMRERMILVAFANGIQPHEFFPNPQNNHLLPRGYEGSRQVALRTVGNRQTDLFQRDTAFIPSPEPGVGIPKAVTAEEALSDLPRITSHLDGTLRRGARRFDKLTPYLTNLGNVTDYAKKMRTWKGFESRLGVYDHVIRYLPRDYDIFERMQPGDQYPEAYQIAIQLFYEKLNKLRNTGREIVVGSPEYEKLYKDTVPPYDPEKFPNKWRKMESDAPARTLMAHLGKDGYSHIHYDSGQKRTISVREAARLQSFPDGFVFAGTMNPAFKQIGNAVPPLLAKAVAEVIMNQLQGE
jgi:DNA (cytosine-5)-methyltransferase 1